MVMTRGSVPEFQSNIILGCSHFRTQQLFSTSSTPGDFLRSLCFVEGHFIDAFVLCRTGTNRGRANDEQGSTENDVTIFWCDSININETLKRSEETQLHF